MSIKTKPPRAYRSSLRDAQSAQTRERILLAAKEFLETDDFENLTLRRLGELADVSAPTVYAHFPTIDALAQAFFFWLKPHIGTDTTVPAFDDFATMPQRLFPIFQRQGRLLRNLMNTPAWDRLRAADWKAKEENWAAPIKAALPQLSAKQVNRAAIALSAFSTPNLWRWLIDITGCSEAEAERIATWATTALVEALQRDASGLDDPSPQEHDYHPNRKERKRIMIHHASLAARDPLHVASVLAELLNGRVYRFPPLPGSFQVVSGDAEGTMLEIYPDGTRLEPEGGFVAAESAATYYPFHLLLSVPVERAAIERVGAREGWRTEFAVAGIPGEPPAFHLYRMWIENRIMLEFVPQAMIGEYQRYMQFERLDAMPAYRLPQTTAPADVVPPVWATALAAAMI